MALYFASVSVAAGQSLQAALQAHYAALADVPTVVPKLIGPTTIMVSWLNLISPDTVNILGTLNVAPYYAPVVPLPAEFPGGGGRNTIALNSIYFDAAATINIAFQII